MNKISFKIAFQEETSANTKLVNFITPEIKAKYEIPEEQTPFASGTQSAVYENSLGQIVAFTKASACDQAYKSIGQNSDILPEVYDIDEIEIYFEFGEKTKKLCVITMEKLTPLTGEDKRIFQKTTKAFYDWRNMKDKWDIKKEEAAKEFLKAELLEKDETEILDLWIKMDESGIGHNDLHYGNIAWGNNGNLKLIDWEDIYVPEYWV